MVGLGLFFIPFSLAILWKNEKRKVTFANLTDKARNICHSVEDNKPNSELEFKLVHVSGVA